jgi:hypothetical protein
MHVGVGNDLPDGLDAGRGVIRDGGLFLSGWHSTSIPDELAPGAGGRGAQAELRTQEITRSSSCESDRTR